MHIALHVAPLQSLQLHDGQCRASSPVILQRLLLSDRPSGFDGLLRGPVLRDGLGMLV